MLRTHCPPSTRTLRACFLTLLSLAACGGDGPTATGGTPPVTQPGNAPVVSVSTGPALDTLEVSEVLGHEATMRDSAGRMLTGRTVRWSSSNPAIATIDSITGALTGVDRGTVTVTARSEGRAASVTRVVVIRYRSITAGSMHACNIASGGIVWCWGLQGVEGRLGSGQPGAGVRSAVPVRVSGTQRYVQVSTYGRTTCGVTTQSDAYCWGSNASGLLGNGTGADQSATPVLVSGGHKFRQVSVGAEAACGLTTAGGLHCWGYNSTHAFAVSEPWSSNVPVAGALGATFASITAGAGYACGVTSTGVARCWGANGVGNLGDGLPPSMTNTMTTAPALVVGGHSFRTLSASTGVTCGVTLAGQAYCWGRGESNRLGTGNTGEVSTPGAVAGSHSFGSIAVGFGATCGIDTASAVWCWGSGENGQLGQVVAGSTGTPVRAGATLTAAEVSPANVATGFGSYTCAISADRLTTLCWGRNDVGQLGNGLTTAADAINATPTAVVGQRPL